MGEHRDLGLKAIDEARADRKRSKHGRISGTTWAAGGAAVLLVVFAAWMFKGSSLTTGQEQLIAQQRAAVKSVGAEWFPLRDKIEKWTADAANGAYPGDMIDREIGDVKWDFRSSPGIYLRLRVEDAKSVESLRKHAKESAKDAFTSCFLREKNPSMARMAKGEDAGTGWQDQPWNLRLAYNATYILSDDWVEEVKATREEMNLRVYVQQYENAKTREIPLTIDIVKKAAFYLFVLDEDVPEAKELADGGKITQAALQQVPHPARVYVIDLKTGKEMVRLRREGDADFRFAGEGSVRDPQILAAMKRQVNNCALAQSVLSAINPDAADAGAPEPGK